MTEEEFLPFCECGKCGLRITKPGNRFIQGHQRRGKKNSPEHNAANSEAHKDVPLSPEHCAAISAALTGIPRTPKHSAAISAAALGVPKSPRTPEHNAAISKGLKNSEAVKAKADAQRGVPLSPEHAAAALKGCEKQRGGNDLINHHYIYDHSDLKLNTIQMTRSDHTSLHNLLRKLGYKVPHINAEEST